MPLIYWVKYSIHVSIQSIFPNKFTNSKYVLTFHILMSFSGVKDNRKSGVFDLVKTIFGTQIANNAADFLDYASGFSEVFFFFYIFIIFQFILLRFQTQF